MLAVWAYTWCCSEIVCLCIVISVWLVLDRELAFGQAACISDQVHGPALNTRQVYLEGARGAEYSVIVIPHDDDGLE